MPQTIKNEAGEDVEVFTKEELDQAADAKATEERERLEAEKQEAIETAEAEKADLEKQLEGYKDKEYNFSKLRNKNNKDKGDQGGDDEKADIQKNIDEINKKLENLSEQPKKETVNEFIKTNVPEDKETRDKFNYYFDRLGKDAGTKEEINKAAKEALQLATGKTAPDNDNSMLSVGASQNYRNQNPNPQSETSKNMAKNLGITEEDRKKYGKKK